MTLCLCSCICLLCVAFILPSPLEKTPERSWDTSNGIHCPNTITAWGAAMPIAVSWQFENVTAYLSGWVAREEPFNLSQRLEWSYLCHVSHRDSPSDPVARRTQHQHSEHRRTEHIHGGKFPMPSQGSSEKLFCKRLLFVEMLHFMSDGMNLKEIIWKAYPRRHVRQTGI